MRVISDKAMQVSFWFERGYHDGGRFARNEATYPELAAIHRSGGIPDSWDIFRAEIRNQFMGDTTFDIRAYLAGFGRACTDFYDAI